MIMLEKSNSFFNILLTSGIAGEIERENPKYRTGMRGFELMEEPMKIDRLIGILSILLQRDHVAAPWLAEKFEVSRRTINRDIEDLCKAGIPIATRRGAKGGISIMENYKIDRTLLTNSEMQAILAGLKSLDSVSGTNRYQCLMEKFAKDEDETVSGNPIFIDLSGWNRAAVAEKIELLKAAIEQQAEVAFQYISPGGESERRAEPYQLIFQWSNWYLWAFCREKQDYRMFKLTRMLGLKCTGERFEKRSDTEYIRQDRWNTFEEIRAVVKFDKSAKWKAVDDFGAERLSCEENGHLLLRDTWPDKASLFHHILSFGDKAEILEPEALRGEFCAYVQKIVKQYIL